MISYKNNLRLYSIFTCLKDPYIIAPILVPFFNNKGISFTQIMLLESFFALSVLLSEVPTGVFADKLSRKSSISIGLILQTFAAFVFVLSNNFYFLAIAEMVWGFGISFKSGSDTALIYDYLKFHNKENTFTKLNENVTFYKLILAGILTLASSFLFIINNNIPFILAGVFTFLALITVINMNETRINKESSFSIKNYLLRIQDSTKYIFKNKKLKILLFYSIGFSGLFMGIHWLYQPYMENVNIPIKYFGLFYLIFNIFSALSAKFSTKYIKLTKGFTLSSFPILTAVSLILIGFINIWIGIFLVVIQQLVRSIHLIAFNKYLNKHIESEQRATIISINSMFSNVSRMLFYPLIGYSVDKTNIFITHILFGICMLFVGLAIKVMFLKIKK